MRYAWLIFVLSAAAAQPQDLREAARLDSEGKCDASAPFYEKALAAAAVSPALLNNAGNHYLLCGQPERARLQFERLVKINPAHTNANLQLARFAVNEKHGDRALAYLARVENAEPAVRLLRAEAFHWAGKRDTALAALTTLETQAGGDASLLVAVGSAFARLGIFDRAENAFQNVLVQRPTDFDVLYSLGRAAARARHYDRAQSVLHAALKLRPGDVEVLLELALAHAALKDYSRAVYLLAQARQKAPKRPDILLALARAAEDAHYYGDSALAYDQYLQLQPDDGIARRDRARVLGYTGARLEEGIKEMTAYISTHSKDPVGYYNLAQFTWRTEPEKSLDQLAAALRLDPKFAPAHVSRAWLLHRLGRSGEAAVHLELALGIAPDNLRAFDQLGVVYLALDRPSDAERVLRRAMAVDAEDPEVLMHLGRALMILNREQEAQRLLDKYRQVRPQWHRDPRREPGMIALATLPEAERRDREIERFRRLSRERPDDPILQRHLAELLLTPGRIEEALPEFTRLLTLNADTRIWEETGRSLVAAGQYLLARQFLVRAVADRPDARLDLAIALLHTEGAAAALKAIGDEPGDQEGDFLLTKARILDAAGRRDEAGNLLTEGLRKSAGRPQVACQAVMQLLQYGRDTEALDLVNRSIASAPDDSDLLLTRTMVLALVDRVVEAEKQLDTIESRWPEWDRPYLVHALVLESGKRNSEAMRKLKIAIGLGSHEPAGKCVLARLSGLPAPGAQCACLTGLRDFASGVCDKR